MSIKQFLDEVHNRLSLAQLVGREVKLQRRGREFVGLCPFHQEKTPSFHVVEDKKFYHCFGCGAHGRALNWLQERQGLNFKEAIQQLAQLSGVALPIFKPQTREQVLIQQKTNELYPSILQKLAEYYSAELYLPKHQPALDYLKTRGLSQATIAQFQLGFAKSATKHDRAVADFLKASFQKKSITITDADLLHLGILRKLNADDQNNDNQFQNKQANDFITLFRNRIMFPIRNQRHQIIGFGGRYMGNAAAANTGKYINSPDSPIFQKGINLYNLDLALTECKNGDPLILVEGYMDVISLFQAGFKTAVAPLGTAVTPEQLQLLWRYNNKTNNPIICLDGDAAGQQAAYRTALRALPFITEAQTLDLVFLPEGEDPDSLLQKNGKDVFLEILQQKTPLHKFLWQWHWQQTDLSRPEGWSGLEHQLLQLCQMVKDPILQRNYQQVFRQMLYEAKTQNFQKNRKTPTNPKNSYGKMARDDRRGGMTPTPIISAALPQQALLAIFSKFPELYQEWQLKNFKLDLPEVLDNYLNNLHIILRTMSKTSHQQEEQYLNELQQEFENRGLVALWQKVWSKELLLFYPQLKSNDKIKAEELMEELVTLLIGKELARDFTNRLKHSTPKSMAQDTAENMITSTARMQNSTIDISHNNYPIANDLSKNSAIEKTAPDANILKTFNDEISENEAYLSHLSHHKK